MKVTKAQLQKENDELWQEVHALRACGAEYHWLLENSYLTRFALKRLLRTNKLYK